MKRFRFIRASWVLLLAALVLGVSFLTPALAATNVARHSNARAAAADSSVDATVYLSLGLLEPRFQANLDQQVPEDVNSAIDALVSKLPTQDQVWTREMATTLIQPSAQLESLVPQQDGLAMSILLSLYPGDPKPISGGILVSFSLLDSSTVQVSTGPIGNGPTLSSGPQSTFGVPMGSLTGVNTTPGCGSSALALHLQIPVSLGQSASTSTQAQTALANVSGGNPMAAALNSKRADSGDTTFIEIPAASLSALSGSMGNMPVGNGFTAQNIRISVEGSTIHILSDIYWSGLNIGTADTTIAPGASGGNLSLQVTNTSFSLFGLFNFPMNSYNQQIQQTLNSKLATAFSGQFYVTNAAIGPNSELPCAASNSLVLTGTSGIGG